MFDCGISSEAGSTGLAEHPTTFSTAASHDDGCCDGSGGRMSWHETVLAMPLALFSSVYPRRIDNRSHYK